MVVPTHAAARSPHMIVFAATAMISAVIQVVIGEQPASLASSVTPAMATSWSLLCAMGGLSVIVGAYIKNPLTGLMVEGAGHFAIATGYLAYSVALSAYMIGTWYAATTFWWSIAFVIASVIRWWMIQRVIHKAKRKAARRRALEERGKGDGN